MASEGVPQPQTKNSGYRSFDGADGEVRIQDGKWHVTPNARFEHLVKNGADLSARALRVYAYLQLKSMNRRGELCAHDLQGEQPVTIDEIAAAAGLDRSDVGKCLDELDACGLGERRPAKDGTRRKLIYSYAEPREPKPDRERVRAPFFPDWFPDHLASVGAYLKRIRFKDFPQDENGARTLFLEKCEKGTRLLEELDELFAREEDSAGAHPLLNKEDRITDIEEQTHQPTVPVLVPEPEPDPEAPEEPAGRSGGGLEVIDGSAKARVGEHLAKFDVPSPLTPETVAVVAEHLPTQALVDHFIEATANDKPRSWGFFIKKAPRIVEDHPRYMAAKAAAGNGSPPGKPLSREEQKVEAWMRRREAQEK